jgi:hypothetical protein
MDGSGYILVAAWLEGFPLAVRMESRTCICGDLALAARRRMKKTYGVIYGKPSSHTSARGVDVEVDRFRRIFGFQE